MATENNKIQFRGKTEKEASRLVDDIRLGGVNISELARQGLQEKLRETLSDEEKIEIHRLYQQGDVADEVAEVLIGDGLDEIERERAAFEEAVDFDIEGVYQS